MRYLLLTFFISLQAQAFTVVIDPGHGGIDVGAIRGSFVESQIVYQIAEKIESELKLKENFTVHLTRPFNRGKSLEDRVKYAMEKQADLFLSLHANSSTSTRVSGMEYYFSSRQPAPVLLKRKIAAADKSPLIETIKNDLINFGKTKESLAFSQSIQAAVQTAFAAETEENTKRPFSKIRRAPFYVIENTTMPSVLVEVGFISNQREARKLISATYQEELARALTEAIVKFKEKSDK